MKALIPYERQSKTGTYRYLNYLFRNIRKKTYFQDYFVVKFFYKFSFSFFVNFKVIGFLVSVCICLALVAKNSCCESLRGKFSEQTGREENTAKTDSKITPGILCDRWALSVTWDNQKHYSLCVSLHFKRNKIYFSYFSKHTKKE